jgi:hypothetical protein
VVERSFPPELDDDDDMDDLFEGLELAANAILAKVNMDEILHVCLDP